MILTLPNVLAGIILIALTAYVLLGGADFGGGVWDLLASGPRREQQRRLVHEAIGPVWEANHVWLILAIVLLFTCFPRGFAAVAIVLHIPLTLMLIGIVLRGSAFVFQSYGGGGGRVFATASLITPVLLGICVGAVASGAVGEVGSGNGEGFARAYVAPWVTPFGFVVGMFALAAFAFLAAVYLTLETNEPQLQEDFRARAAVAGGALVGLAVVGIVLFRGILPFHPRVVALTAAAAVATFWGLWRRRYRLARVTAALEVTLIMVGWAAGQYPHLLPPQLTIAEAAAPRITLELALIAVSAGAVVLFPSLFYLMRIFKGKRTVNRRMPSVVPPTTPPTLPQ
jgi:cytochrome bd ubiquinol oxidase subunit II